MDRQPAYGSSEAGCILYGERMDFKEVLENGKDVLETPIVKMYKGRLFLTAKINDTFYGVELAEMFQEDLVDPRIGAWVISEIGGALFGAELNKDGRFNKWG